MEELERRILVLEARQAADRGAILTLARIMVSGSPKLIKVIPASLMIWAEHCRDTGDERGARASEALADQLVQYFPPSDDQSG